MADSNPDISLTKENDDDDTFFNKNEKEDSSTLTEIIEVFRKLAKLCFPVVIC